MVEEDPRRSCRQCNAAEIHFLWLDRNQVGHGGTGEEFPRSQIPAICSSRPSDDSHGGHSVSDLHDETQGKENQKAARADYQESDALDQTDRFQAVKKRIEQSLQ